MSSFDNEALRYKWPKGVAVCAAAAVHATIAMSLGHWRDEDWERQIDAREGGGDWEFTRKYRKHHAPKAGTVQRICAAIPGCAAMHWAQHPLWHLLATTPVRYAALDLALDSLEGRIRSFLWVEPLGPEPRRGSLRAETTPELLEELAEMEDEQALIALVALALEVRAARQHRLMYHSARALLKLVPNVLKGSLPLYAGWPALVDLFSSNIWQPHPGITSSHAWIRFNRIELTDQLRELSLNDTIAEIAPPRRYMAQVERAISFNSRGC